MTNVHGPSQQYTKVHHDHIMKFKLWAYLNELESKL